MRSFIRKSLVLAIALLAGVMTTAFKAEGLEVMFALYGDLNANHADKKQRDVTEIVKAQVGSNEAYSFNERIKNVMFTAAGIDPAPGVVKGLLVVYSNVGNVYLHFSNETTTTIMPDKTDYNLGPINNAANLQVLAAVYGNLNKSGVADKSDFARSKDLATARLLQNNAMTIPPGEQKSQMFGDPAFGVYKGFLAVVSSGNNLYIGCYGQTETGTLSSTSYQFSATVGAAIYAQPRIKWTQTGLAASTIAAGGYVDYSANPPRIDPSRGKVWMALTPTGNRKLRDWNGNDWNPAVPDYPMGVTSIAVNGAGRPWIRNGLGIQFLSADGKWKKAPGNPASSLHSNAIGGGAFWYIGKNGMVYALQEAFAELGDGTPGSVQVDSVSAPSGGATGIYFIEGVLYVVGPQGLFQSSYRGGWPPGPWAQVNTGNVKVVALAAGKWVTTSGWRMVSRMYVLGQDGKIYSAGFDQSGALVTKAIDPQPAVYPNENYPLPVTDIAVEDGLETDGGLRIWAIDRSNAIYRSAPTFQ